MVFSFADTGEATGEATGATSEATGATGAATDAEGNILASNVERMTGE